MQRKYIIFTGLFILVFMIDFLSAASTYYAVRTFQASKSSSGRNPSYGSIFSYQPVSSRFSFFSNFSFHIDDNRTDLYYFQPGPVAIRKNSSPIMYMSIQCGTAFQRLFLLSFDMRRKTYKQSPWILHNGIYFYLFYDPIRQRLFGLRDQSTFTLIMEEYDKRTLNTVRQYTTQDVGQYAFSYRGCAVFDYEENWVVEVRTRLEDGHVNAYFIKMDLNLVGKKEDIVSEFYLLPDIHYLCSMTYDIKTKLILVTWLNGSLNNDLFMFHMNPHTSEFSNKALLLRTPKGWVVELIQAVFDQRTRQTLFIVGHRQDITLDRKVWQMYVDFDTMKVSAKKQITKPNFDVWELFIA